MYPQTKRECVVVLVRAVAHLYATAGALASRREWDAGERAAELVRVLEMLKAAYEQLAAVPDCAASVFEQFMVVRSVQASAVDDVQAAMALARAGLVLNTWCTATTMLVSTQATDGPLSIGGLLQTLGTLHPDPQYQAAVAEQLATTAYDNSAARLLGACYFQAHEGYSVLELHRLLATGVTSHAADLFDNASRGALTAVRFLERELREAEDSNDALAEDRDGSDDALRGDHDGSDGALRGDHDGSDRAQPDDSDDRALADDSDDTAAEADDTSRETDKPEPSPRTTTVAAARGPPVSPDEFDNARIRWHLPCRSTPGAPPPARTARAGMCPMRAGHERIATSPVLDAALPILSSHFAVRPSKAEIQASRVGDFQ